MKEILDNPMEPFGGGVPIVFSEDFTKLSPVGVVPLYKFDKSFIWKEIINLFMEFKNIHRFDRDPQWGKLLRRFRKLGPDIEDVAIINTRVVEAKNNGPLEKKILPVMFMQQKQILIEMAINDAIFAKHLEETHSKDPNVQLRMHTLCIKAGTLRLHVRGTGNEYHPMQPKAQDIIYAAVGEAHVRDKSNKYHDPLLKLYDGRPLCA
ncbi:hypothetical protein IV203_001658 [Nitzschia inconspicua]|uniref:Uncharacterized protein n=1 Tax=Nitzschia inconspicua TaxID=303405 RepID=A0A9K3L8M8_9STRA|nr:hypothetical protein IV203_001658 [Nitzschia inconspicua]